MSVVARIEAARLKSLKPRLDALLDQAALLRRLHNDPIELVQAYSDPRDVEVAGLLCASLAYGRVDLFKPVLRRLLGALGDSPAGFALRLRKRGANRDFAIFRDFVYRFNVGTDLACLFWACGEALEKHGSLEALFQSGLPGPLSSALSNFTSWLRGRDFRPVVRRLGPPRALDHLLPDPSRGGSCKRLNLYLRWMIRGPDAIDRGVWDVSPSLLVIPLDTHIARMARNLRLTRRSDLSWRTAEEITAALRELDPADPTKYDFALCHFGMSGACPAKRTAQRCSGCQLRPSCEPGTRLTSPLRERSPAGRAQRGTAVRVREVVASWPSPDAPPALRAGVRRPLPLGEVDFHRSRRAR